MILGCLIVLYKFSLLKFIKETVNFGGISIPFRAINAHCVLEKNKLTLHQHFHSHLFFRENDSNLPKILADVLISCCKSYTMTHDKKDSSFISVSSFISMRLRCFNCWIQNNCHFHENFHGFDVNFTSISETFQKDSQISHFHEKNTAVLVTKLD